MVLWVRSCAIESTVQFEQPRRAKFFLCALDKRNQSSKESFEDWFETPDAQVSDL